MASLLGLGDISQKIQAILKKVRQPIEKVIDWLINQAVKFAKKVGKFVKKTGGKIGKKLGFGKPNKDQKNKAIQDKRTDKEKEQDLQSAVALVKTLSQQSDANPKSIKQQLPSIKNTYRLKKLELIKGQNNNYQVHGEFNPSIILDLPALAAGDQEVEAKLSNLRLKPKDVDLIVASLKKTGGGDAVGVHIKSGIFDKYTGYHNLLSSLKLRTEIPAILQAMNKGKQLLDSGQKTLIFEEKPTKPPHYDIDVGAVSSDGSLSLAYQLKYVEGNASVSKNATKAAKQLINAPAMEKWIEIQVHNGTWKDFETENREKGIKTTFKAQYPNINLRIIFSDSVEKVY